MNEKLNIVPLGTLILSTCLSVLLHIYIPLKTVISSPYSVIGLLIFLSGLALNLYSISLLVRHKTDIRPGGIPSFLVTYGPFSLSRNPIYLGDVIMLVGIAIFLGTLSSFIVPFIFFLIINIWVIPFEERTLKEKFADAYLVYKKRVRRWM